MRLPLILGAGLFLLAAAPAATDEPAALIQPSDADRLMQYSTTALEQKRYQAALIFALEAYRVEGDPERKTAIAVVARKIEELAAQFLPPALSPTPKEVEKEYRKGLQAYVDDRLIAARNAFKKVLELDPGHIRAFIALNRLQMEIKE